MLIDLLPTFTRFNVERFPESLVVLIPHGVIRGPLLPAGASLSVVPPLEPLHEGVQGEQHFLAYQILPGGTATFEDPGSTGWSFSAQITNEHQAFFTFLDVVLIQEGDQWVARLKDGRVAGFTDVTLPNYDPTFKRASFESEVAEHIPTVWDRLMADDES